MTYSSSFHLVTGTVECQRDEPSCYSLRVGVRVYILNSSLSTSDRCQTSVMSDAPSMSQCV